MADEQVVKFRFTSDATGLVREFDTLEDAQQALASETKRTDAALKAQAKQLGLTQAQMRRLNQSIGEVNVTKQAAAQEAARLAAAQAQVAAKGKRSAQAMQSLAIQLPDVAAQAAAGTDAFTILAQQGLQVVQVNFDLVTAAAKKVRTAIGPLGLAMATAAGVAATLANNASRVNEEMNILEASSAEIARLLGKDAKAAREAASGMDAVREATAEAALQTKILNGEITEAQADFQRANKEIRAAAEGSLDATKRLVTTLGQAIDAQQRLVDAELIGSDARAQAEAQLDRLIQRREKANEQLREQGMATNEAIAAARELANAQQAAADLAAAEAEARANAINLARLEAQAKRDAAAAQREYNAALRASQQQLTETARQTNEGLREVEAAWQELLDKIDAMLNERAQMFEAHFMRVSTLSQSFGSQLIQQQGNLREALLNSVREMLAAELGELGRSFALKAAGYALVGNLPAAAAHTAGAAALGVTSGVLQAGGIRALNGTGSRRGDRSGRR